MNPRLQAGDLQGNNQILAQNSGTNHPILIKSEALAPRET